MLGSVQVCIADVMLFRLPVLKNFFAPPGNSLERWAVPLWVFSSIASRVFGYSGDRIVGWVVDEEDAGLYFKLFGQLLNNRISTWFTSRLVAMAAAARARLARSSAWRRLSSYCFHCGWQARR